VAWVWDFPKAHEDFSADIDYEASAPMTSTEYLSDKPVDPDFRPVFRSRASMTRFKRYHCPPIWVAPAVDAVWRDIILKFVPPDRIQFLPLRLIARGDVCDNFMWVIPFDRVICVDAEQSEVTRGIQKPDRTIIYGVRKVIHKSDCLGSLHLARDKQMKSQMLVSSELRDALAATGEYDMFYKPEESTYTVH
jgi:hypothetical protein